MKLSIHLVTWNGAKFIPSLFASLKNSKFQILPPWAGPRPLAVANSKFFILDNGSTDNTVPLLKKELINFPISHELIEGKENLGFAGGHNLLLRKAEAEFVLLLNQDLSLEPDCISILLQTMEEHTELAAIAPRLMRLNTSGIIDSLGLKKFRSGRVIDQYAGQEWSNVKSQVSNVSRVFGISGTAPMFRLSALRDIAFPDDSIFDESYGSYKEDVDLAWRLHSRGYKAAVVLDTVAYHARGSGQVLGEDQWSAVKNKQQQPFFIRKYSYRNHLATVYKNESWQRALLDFPWIVWYEGKKFFCFLLFDREVLVGIRELWQQREALKKKRQWIQKKRTV